MRYWIKGVPSILREMLSDIVWCDPFARNCHALQTAIAYLPIGRLDHGSQDARHTTPRRSRRIPTHPQW